MKLTKQQLKQIIKEELEKVLKEDGGLKVEYVSFITHRDLTIWNFKVGNQEVQLGPGIWIDTEDFTEALSEKLGFMEWGSEYFAIEEQLAASPEFQQAMEAAEQERMEYY